MIDLMIIIDQLMPLQLLTRQWLCKSFPVEHFCSSLWHCDLFDWAFSRGGSLEFAFVGDLEFGDGVFDSHVVHVGVLVIAFWGVLVTGNCEVFWWGVEVDEVHFVVEFDFEGWFEMLEMFTFCRVASMSCGLWGHVYWWVCFYLVKWHLLFLIEGNPLRIFDVIFWSFVCSLSPYFSFASDWTSTFSITTWSADFIVQINFSFDSNFAVNWIYWFSAAFHWGFMLHWPVCPWINDLFLSKLTLDIFFSSQIIATLWMFLAFTQLFLSNSRCEWLVLWLWIIAHFARASRIWWFHSLSIVKIDLDILSCAVNLFLSKQPLYRISVLALWSFWANLTIKLHIWDQLIPIWHWNLGNSATFF